MVVSLFVCYAFISAYIRRTHVISRESAVQDRLALPFLALARPVPGRVDTRPGLTLAVLRLMDGFVILQVTSETRKLGFPRNKQIKTDLVTSEAAFQIQEGWQSELSDCLSV